MILSIDTITVCICTFRRPAMLKQLLDAIACQQTNDCFNISIVVVDNDAAQSAFPAVSEFSASSPMRVCYCTDNIPNIARARNTAVANAKGDYLAFIDDDEIPSCDWLLHLWRRCRTSGVAGVLGPVLPRYEFPPPEWLIKGRLHERPAHPTGHLMTWEASRTGNVLLRRDILNGVPGPFNPEFGTGGEDQDFFRRLMARGNRFIWCAEAPVYETVPPHRCEHRFMLQRALLRGRITLRHPGQKLRKLGTSLIAAPVYALALPFLYLLKYPLFARYSVRFCDHLGRLLAAVGMNTVRDRCH